MFSMDNLVELVKSVVKSAALILIGAYVLWGMLPQLLLLPSSPPAAIGSAVWYALLRIGIWTIFVFFFVSVLDAWYQKFYSTTQLLLRRRDLRQADHDRKRVASGKRVSVRVDIGGRRNI